MSYEEEVLKHPRVNPAGAGIPSLTDQENRSLTRGELRVSDGERRTYGEAVRVVNDAGVDYVLSGLFAVHAYTGISRPINDLDLLVKPEQVVRAARALAERGFRTVLEESHWLAKARRDDRVVDLVFGMSNGLFLIDDAWKRRGVEGTLCGEPVLLASPEDLIFHRLFITERHRFDMSDIVHLILACHEDLDWEWILVRVGEHWRLLLAQILFFDFSYPRRRHQIPRWVREELHRRLHEEPPPRDDGLEPCMGTLISRFSFAVDVNEWHFRDRRAETVRATRSLPLVRRIASDDVWDLRREDSAGRPDQEGEDAPSEDSTHVASPSEERPGEGASHGWARGDDPAEENPA